MLVEYGGDCIELNTLKTFSDITKFLDNIEGQEKIDMRDIPYRNLNRKYFIPINTLSPKEIAIANLILSLTQKKVKVSASILTFQQEVSFSIARAFNIQDEGTRVNIGKYTEFNHLKIVLNVAKRYLEASLYEKVGFGTFVGYDVDGSVSILKDLRDLNNAFT
jgi:hypothetical protein